MCSNLLSWAHTFSLPVLFAFMPGTGLYVVGNATPLDFSRGKFVLGRGVLARTCAPTATTGRSANIASRTTTSATG